MIIGGLAVVLLIIIPLLSTVISNARTVQQSTLENPNTQGMSLSQLQSVPSNPHELVIAAPKTNHPAPPVYAEAAYLLNADSETTVYAKNPFLHLPMLSTTKLMTATLAAQSGDIDRKITISAAMEHDIKGLSADSALFGVKQGETYTLRELLYGLLYLSGNDAALVIADAIAGNVGAFVAKMNEEAQQLGLHDTHFANPHGLLSAGQYSCARDLAVLGQYSLSIPLLKDISGGKTYHIPAGGKHPARALMNENQFLWWYPGVTGGKTGFDGGSDFVQVMTVTRNNQHFVGVVIHTNDWWTDMRDLMDYGSGNYTWASPHDTEASGQLIPYDTLWNYFASDKQQNTIATVDQGQYFIKTGYTVSGLFLAYFNKHNGLKTFGYPTRMPVVSNSSVMMQQFEHGRVLCNLSTKQCNTG